MQPTTNSLGQPLHATSEGIARFWNWFGDSKVVDAQGRPLVVYHGGDFGISTFDTSRGADCLVGAGSYFTDNRKEASAYADGRIDGKAKAKNAHVYAAYLRIERPADLRADSWNTDAPVQSYIEDMNYAGLGDALRVDHDGVVYDGDFAPMRILGNHFVAFDPSQIKSADSNTGSFDTGSTNITAMAAPLAHHKDLILYHGTTDEEDFAQSILRDGYLQGRIVQGKAQQAPVKGYVYTTKDIMYAAGYAGVYTSWGLGCTSRRRNGEENFTGYVFVVDASKAEDVLVDEDVLGEIGTSSDNRYGIPDEWHNYLKRRATECATPNQMKKARDGDMAYQSAIGKKMQKPLCIPHEAMQKLVDHCPHLALKDNEQRMPIVGYYTINKCVADSKEFFANATYHEYKQQQAMASSTIALASVLSAHNISHIVVAADDSSALASLRDQVQGILRDLGYPNLPTPVIEIKHRYDSDYLAQCNYIPDEDMDNTKIVFMRNVTENPELARRILVHELCHHIDFMVYWSPLAHQSKTQYNREMRQKERIGDSSDHGAHGKFWQALAAKANALYGEGYVQKHSDKAAREQQADIPPYYILLKNDLLTKKMTMARASKPSTIQKLYLSKLEQMDPDHEVYKLVKSTNPTLAGSSALIGKGFVSFRDADLNAMLSDMWNNAEPISMEAPEPSKNAGYYVLVYREERRDGRIMFRWAQASRPSAAQKAYIARAIMASHNTAKLFKVASANLARGIAVGKGQGFIPETTPQGVAVQQELAALWDSGTELTAGLS